MLTTQASNKRSDIISVLGILEVFMQTGSFSHGMQYEFAKAYIPFTRDEATAVAAGVLLGLSKTACKQPSKAQYNLCTL